MNFRSKCLNCGAYGFTDFCIWCNSDKNSYLLKTRETDNRISNGVKILAVDVDGTLAQLPECYTEEECLNAKPNITVVNHVNNYDRSWFVVAYTARVDKLLPATVQWLRKHNIRFDAISNNKMVATRYLDDKFYSIDNSDNKMINKTPVATGRNEEYRDDSEAQW